MEAAAMEEAAGEDSDGLLEFYSVHADAMMKSHTDSTLREHASCRRFVVALIALALAACATVGPPSREGPGVIEPPPPVPTAPPIPRNVEPPPPKLNLSGFPLPYRQGYADGCASATGAERKDATRFSADMNYRTGWQDGRALCKK
jgi:hypothetical protein